MEIFVRNDTDFDSLCTIFILCVNARTKLAVLKLNIINEETRHFPKWHKIHMKILHSWCAVNHSKEPCLRNVRSSWCLLCCLVAHVQIVIIRIWTRIKIFWQWLVSSCIAASSIWVLDNIENWQNIRCH